MEGNVLILDTETTGIQTTAKVIEIGAALWSLDHSTLISATSFILPCDENPAEKVNRIPLSVLNSLDAAYAKEYGVMMLTAMFGNASVCVAHRAEFDRPKLYATLPQLQSFGLPWVCSKFDFEWPESERQGGSLINIQLEHGLGVANAHRALSDCLGLAALFGRLGPVWLKEQIFRGLRPKAFYVSTAPFEQKDLVKSYNFQWHDKDSDGSCFCKGADVNLCKTILRKKWAKYMPIADAEMLPFSVRRIDDTARG